MSERKQNWYQRFKKSFGPGLFVETGNPTEGIGGKDCLLYTSPSPRDRG